MILFLRVVMLAAVMARAPSTPRELSILNYGACQACSPATNSDAFAGALAAAGPGDVVTAPSGLWRVGVTGLRAIALSKAVTVRGAGRDLTTVQIDPAVVAVPDTNWRVFEVTGSGAAIEDLTISGAKPGSGTLTVYDLHVEHHTGIFVGPDVSGFALRRANIIDTEGDGLQLYTGTASPVIEDSLFAWTQRSGLSFTPGVPERPVTDPVVSGCTFRGVTGQPIDNEHGPALRAQILNNTIEASLNNYGITVSGYDDAAGAMNRSKDWVIRGNKLAEPILVIRADNTLIEGNEITSPFTKSGVTVSRGADLVTVRGNRITMLQTTVVSIAGVEGIGTTETPPDPDGPGPLPAPPPYQAYPSRIVVTDNEITIAHPSGFGFRCQACESFTVERNILTGTGMTSSSSAGVYARATIAARDAGDGIVRGNTFVNWGRWGVTVQGNAAARMRSIEVGGNRFRNTSASGPMKTAISLDDGFGALQSAKVYGNVRGCGVTFDVASVPPGAALDASPIAIAQGCP